MITFVILDMITNVINELEDSMTNRVSDSEKIVLEILWQESPLCSQDVVDRLDNQGWNEKTVKTFLNRLVKKGVVSFKKEGRRYWYSPAVNKTEILSEESDGFLKRVFHGDMKALLATFVENKQLSKEELNYLKKLLEQEQK